MPSAKLQARGARFVDGTGRPIRLRGFGLGGWMNMENFITGYPGTESQCRSAIRGAVGESSSQRFFDRLLTTFFDADDVAFIRSLGLNCLRLPLNYRHLENDADPFVVKEDGFKHLDRVIELCAQQGIYTVIDLHALPGFQNQDWHCDNPTHHAFFWDHPHFQERVVNLWQVIADRYRDQPWIAGYNLVNEPCDPTKTRLAPYYQRLVAAIRMIDSQRILFLDGDRYATDFSAFGKPDENVVYSCHDYCPAGFPAARQYPGEYEGKWIGATTVEDAFLRRTEVMRSYDSPIWVGEFGPTYTEDPEIDVCRTQILRDQLAVYDRHGASWSLWTYKDIGLQGTVYAAPNSPWLELLKPILGKKARLGTDTWGGTDDGIIHIMEPIYELMRGEFRNFRWHPFGTSVMTRRIVRGMLFTEPLLDEFGALFRGLCDGDLDELADSFRFDRCVRRPGIVTILSENARGEGG